MERLRGWAVPDVIRKRLMPPKPPAAPLFVWCECLLELQLTEMKPPAFSRWSFTLQIHPA